jgi:signal transduction histidine kinase
MSGDTAQIERVKARFKDDKKTDKEVKSEIEFAMRKALRDNDTRIREAAQAVIDGNPAERIRITREIKAEGNFSQDIIVGAINAELTAMRKELKEAK